MTQEMTQSVEQSHLEPRSRSGTMLPAIALFFLAPLVGEFLLGNLSITSLGLLLVLAPLYGGGALLIREVARRWHLGWPSIVVLGYAYALIEEAFVTQSLFNANYVGLRLLDYGYIAGLGISAWWTVFVLSIHAIWSTSVPITLVEIFTPETDHTPWLGPIGLVIVALLYLAACALLFFFQMSDAFIASMTQFLVSGVVVVILIVGAFVLPRFQRREPDDTQSTPDPWPVGVLAFTLGSAFMILARTHEPIPAVLNTVGLLCLLALGFILFWRWSSRIGWTLQHAMTLSGSLLMTYAWYGFVQRPSTGSASSQIDLVGNVIFALGAIVLLAIANQRVGVTW
ncbi:MAG: hypothetical protein U0175_34105 [Caldilineaceae bacterium]